MVVGDQGSVVATVDAGCQPVRVDTAANGTQVWVTARASDDVLCFAAALLVTDPSHALVAVVRVGEAPVGLTVVRDGTLIVVADSNRFSAPGAHADLTLINVADALDGRPATVGDIPAGLFPQGHDGCSQRHGTRLGLQLRPVGDGRHCDHPLITAIPSTSSPAGR